MSDQAVSETNTFDFMAFRKVAFALSVALIVISIGSLIFNGLKFGLDFTGGMQVEVTYSEAADLAAIRQALEEVGIENPVVVNFGADDHVMLRLQAEPSAELTAQLQTALAAPNPDFTILRTEYVGPQVGDELRDQGGLGLMFALIVVMAYVALRFQYKFSFGAVVALIHDVIITLGVFSILQLDFDLTVLAALLAVIGYSLNDTIVVSDRIRENFRKMRKGSPLDVINESLSQTLGRTLVTSGTTLLVLLMLFFFGGELIHAFSIALIVGVLIGTYSSIYVAANMLLVFGLTKEDMMEPEKEGAELDEMP